MPDSASSPVRFGNSQIHSLTALRGLAAWWVVLFHFDAYLLPYFPSWAYNFVSKGYLAVDLFFCLSGFVIFYNYGNLNLASKRQIGVFYIKRLAKIYPLHLLVLCLYVTLLGLLLLTHHGFPEQRFSVASFLQNLLLVQDWAIASELSWNVPSWSISAELAAYLLFPAVVLAVRQVAGRVAASLIAIFLLLCLLNFFYSSTDFLIGKEIPTFGVVRCVTQFAIGAILAQLYLMRSFAYRFAGPCLLALTVLCLLIGFERFESVFVPLSWAALVMAIALGVAGSGFLNWRALVFVGEISYSTYMIHYLVRDVFKLILVRSGPVTPLSSVLWALFVIFVASIPLYLLIERPAQKYLTAKAKLKGIAAKPTGQAA